MNDFAQRLALHNATAELEALRMEGRGMLWQNEQQMLRQEYPVYGEADFNALAVKIRATKVEIDDVIAFGSATR